MPYLTIAQYEEITGPDAITPPKFTQLEEVARLIIMKFGPPPDLSEMAEAVQAGIRLATFHQIQYMDANNSLEMLTEGGPEVASASIGSFSYSAPAEGTDASQTYLRLAPLASLYLEQLGYPVNGYKRLDVWL